MSFGDFLANNLHQFWILTGFHNATWEHFVMLAVGLFFIWLAIKKDFEPMLLVPIGFGILIGNIPFNTTAGLDVGIYEEGSVLNILYNGVSAEDSVCLCITAGCLIPIAVQRYGVFFTSATYCRRFLLLQVLYYLRLSLLAAGRSLSAPRSYQMA